LPALPFRHRAGRAVRKLVASPVQSRPMSPYVLSLGLSTDHDTTARPFCDNSRINARRHLYRRGLRARRGDYSRAAVFGERPAITAAARSVYLAYRIGLPPFSTARKNKTRSQDRLPSIVTSADKICSGHVSHWVDFVDLTPVRIARAPECFASIAH
jgi:hypothetical protein